MTSLRYAITSCIRQWSVFAALVLALAFCSGCGWFSEESFSMSGSVTQRDGVIRVEGNRLYANGEYYGRLKSGCRVELDEQGQVFIDGVKHNPLRE